MQKGQTIADYCFFTDYFFQPKPSRRSELSKYKLAKSLFHCIRDLTAGHISDDKILITNLCNETLPSSPKGKINYIPPEEAEAGLGAIRALLKDSSVKLIFPMSQQVNYWLQKLGFYSTGTPFLDKSEPKEIGVKNKPPYYSSRKSGAFKEICGSKYMVSNQYHLFPILHVKNYPLKGKFLAYKGNYSNCIAEVGVLTDSLKAINEL